METVIFGGSFNPPTTGHLEIARACLENFGFDELWLMPSGTRKDKQYSIHDDHRLKMLALMRQHINDSRVRISSYELDLPRPSQTMNTLGALAITHPKLIPTLVFGADSYWNMASWKGGDYIRKNVQMLIVPRAAYSLPKAPNTTPLRVPDTILNISSSGVRERIAANQPISGYVDETVERYIVENGLYTPQVSSKSA